LGSETGLESEEQTHKKYDLKINIGKISVLLEQGWQWKEDDNNPSLLCTHMYMRNAVDSAGQQSKLTSEAERT
jgi:hypothetical protein